MKKLHLLLGSSFITMSTMAQLHEFSLGYTGSTPQGLMKNGWNSAHGINIGYAIPIRSLPALSVGFNADYSMYASKRSPQQYRFADGSITNTSVSLSSSIASFGGKMRYTYTPNKKLSPFMELQAGYLAMFSSYYIEDPADPLGCRALENETVTSGGTFFGAIGLGTRWNIAADEKGNRHALEIRINSARGGNIEYSNMNRLYHDHNEINGTGNAQRGVGERPLMVTFLNVSNNQQHQHSIAEIYKHPLRMWQFQLGYVYTFNHK